MEGDPIVGSSSSSAIKKRRRESEVWVEMRKYRDIDGNDKAECNHCKKLFDGSSKKGTTHLKNHLERCRANPKRKGGDGRPGDDQDQSQSPSIKTKELASLIVKENSIIGLIKHLSNMEGYKESDPQVLNSRKDEILQLYQEEKENLCQSLNNLSCRFSLELVYSWLGKDRGCFLVAYYIDDCWERQSKIISFWKSSPDDFQNSMEAVQQSCLDWKIDSKICSLLLPIQIRPADDGDNQIGKMESWFSGRRSLPFAGIIHDAHQLRDYNFRNFENYARDGILRPIRQYVDCVYNKSTSYEPIQSNSAVEKAISELELASLSWLLFDCVDKCLKELCFALEQLDSNFRSSDLTEQKWDEVTATFEHLKFLKDVTLSFLWGTCDIPIIVDLPYVHKTLTDRCNHRIEDCFFCQKAMKEAIDLCFSKHYLVKVIAVILDPRFKMDGLQLYYKEIYGSDADTYLEKVNKDFRDVYDEYAATDSSNSKSYEMLDAMGRPSSPKSELDRYFNLLKVPRDKQFDKLAWWRGNAPSFPTLARMARDYLAIEEPFAPNRGTLLALQNLIIMILILMN